MLEIEEKEYLYKEIRKQERLYNLTNNFKKKKQIEYNLNKLYKRLTSILFEEKKGTIPLPQTIVDNTT